MKFIYASEITGNFFLFQYAFYSQYSLYLVFHYAYNCK